jgi:hypothetical protein
LGDCSPFHFQTRAHRCQKGYFSVCAAFIVHVFDRILLMNSLGKSLSGICIALLWNYYHFWHKWAKRKGISKNWKFTKCSPLLIISEPYKYWLFYYKERSNTGQNFGNFLFFIQFGCFFPLNWLCWNLPELFWKKSLKISKG